MFKLLIFAGTTEGRELAEFCVENGIKADVSAATQMGASLLPKGCGILSGRRNALEIEELLAKNSYSAVIDATHPYAKDVTKNIKIACEAANVRYYRLLRSSLPAEGTVVNSMEELVSLLNKTDKTVLSTLGSKAAKMLLKVKRHKERLWLRMLPNDDIKEYCKSLGFDENKLIFAKGPFGVEENIEHIRKSGAKLMVTKESGNLGGYPEKVRAAELCNIELVTLSRPEETGLSLEEVKQLAIKMSEEENGT